MSSRPDAIVIGAGAVGASTALHLAKAGVRVLVLEKEAGPAAHQSGRNSGVAHVGYNLKPGSLKAKYCVDGNRRLKAFCREHGVPLEEGGILIVARTEEEHATIEELKRRADANGVQSTVVQGAGLKEIEPHAAGISALHAPEGASFDSAGYVHALLRDAEGLKAEVRYGTAVREIEEVGADGRIGGWADGEADGAAPSPIPASRFPLPEAKRSAVRVVTSHGTLEAGVVVNCAGLHADRLAGPLARDVRVIPFRGYYAELRPSARHLVRSHIYGPPDLAFPFLGVHASRRTDGTVLIGPGAMLAFGREAYTFFGVNPRDLAGTLFWPGFAGLFRDPRFRRLIRSEVAKSLSLRAIWREAQLLIPELRPDDLARSFAGNRAQLVRRDGTLVNDILVRETDHAVHVLNAVSPGLTASLPFGEELARRAVGKL